MLHWLYVFSFITFCCLISLGFLNKSLFNLLLLSEAIMLLLFFTTLLLANFYNIYYLLAVAFFTIVFGGLELALNLLLTVYM